MDGMTRTKHLSQCGITHHYDVRAVNEKKVTCEVYCLQKSWNAKNRQMKRGGPKNRRGGRFDCPSGPGSVVEA